jgi:hypothetical protein
MVESQLELEMPFLWIEVTHTTLLYTCPWQWYTAYIKDGANELGVNVLGYLLGFTMANAALLYLQSCIFLYS